MARFDYFVILADRRTGSNFLEANINEIDGLTCHGEAFNPTFIGYPNRTDVLGVSRTDRDDNPDRLLARIKEAAGLNGFRYFNSHDDRIFDKILSDPRCAKIVLTRNPIESFVSLEIARATNQWKLTDVSRLRSEAIKFDPKRFERHLSTLEAFQRRVLSGLQKTGQTAFYLDYEDLHDLGVINGLTAYLGCAGRLATLDTSLKKQNPGQLSEKVVNFGEMEQALAQLDWFNLGLMSNFESRRGPSVPTYLAAPKSALLYMPIRSGPEAAVGKWLAALDGVAPDGLVSGFTQKSLQDWQRRFVGHRSFTVLRHPVARAHSAFCDKILPAGGDGYVQIRKILIQEFNLKMPSQRNHADYDPSAHKNAFLGFLRFVNFNLGGQTAIRVDPHWSTQTSALQGFAKFVTPDMVLREDQLEEDLAILAARIGKQAVPQLTQTDPHEDQLRQIYDKEIEAVVSDAYRRDYVAFGFGPYA